MCKTRTFIVCAVAALACVTVSYNVVADTAYVRVDGDNGTANPPEHGAAWGAAAYKYLQDGIDHAQWEVQYGGYEDAEVWVAAANDPYRPDRDVNNQSGSGDRNASFHLLNNVILYGGFEGDETALSQRNIYMNETVLSGDLNGNDGPNFANRDENSYRVVRSLSNASTAQIDGFIITAGNSDNQGDGAPDPEGGGMYASNSAAGVINCTFTSNSAGWEHPDLDTLRSEKGSGGALYVASTGWITFTLVNCTFSENRALYGGHGGAIHTKADLQVVNGLFEENDAQPTGWTSDISGEWCQERGYGGAIYNQTKFATCINCTFVKNEAYDDYYKFDISGYGGAIYSTGDDALLTVTSCILWENDAEVGEQIEIASGSSQVMYSDVDGGWPGATNIDADPKFGEHYRLMADSPCIDVGDPDESKIPLDLYDVDDDLDYTERTPDLDLRTRILYGQTALRVDMGAYEHDGGCVGDIDGNQVVNVADLLILLGNWGTSGPGDLDGNGIVNTADLLLLLGNWGPCGKPGMISPPQSVLDCMQRYGLDPVKLEACIEGMIRAGTP